MADAGVDGTAIQKTTGNKHEGRVTHSGNRKIGRRSLWTCWGGHSTLDCLSLVFIGDKTESNSYLIKSLWVTCCLSPTEHVLIQVGCRGSKEGDSDDFRFCIFVSLNKYLNGQLGEEQNLKAGGMYQYVYVFMCVCVCVWGERDRRNSRLSVWSTLSLRCLWDIEVMILTK